MGGEAGPRPLGSPGGASGARKSPGRGGRSPGGPDLSLSPGLGPGAPPRALHGALPSPRPRLGPAFPLYPAAAPAPDAARLSRSARKCLECVRLWTRILSIYSRSVHRTPPQLFPGQQLLPSPVTSLLVAADPPLGAGCSSFHLFSSLISWRLR